MANKGGAALKLSPEALFLSLKEENGETEEEEEEEEEAAEEDSKFASPLRPQ